MTKPRQLAPTVGLSHDGFKFLEGSFEGLKGYAVGRMTKSRHGKLYIDRLSRESRKKAMRELRETLDL